MTSQNKNEPSIAKQSKAQECLHPPTDFASMDELTSAFLTLLPTAWVERWRQINIIPLRVNPSQGELQGKWSHFFLCLTEKLLESQALTFRRESKFGFAHNLIMFQQGFYTACPAQWIAISRLIILSIRPFLANHLLLLSAKPRSKKAALASGWCNPKLTNALSITSISCLSESH